VSVGLCGCNKQQSPSLYQENGIEILSYNVTTHWSAGSVMDKTFQYYKESGFYHNIPENATLIDTYYQVNFTVKNNAGKLINLITIKVILYDIDNNELYSSTTLLSDLPNSYTKDASVIFLAQAFPYFNKAEKVGFSISVTQIPTP
jgi:hypothetical protein